jgi:hypothetical protein
VIPDETSPTFPDPADADAERALRRDLVLLAAQRRLRRRDRGLRSSASEGRRTP